MATNNFKAFGIGAGANVTSQSDYEALAALLTGFQSGKASSAQINKALRQSSTMAYVLAQFISDSAAVDVLDNGTPATILANLKAAMTSVTPGRLLNVQVITATGTYTPTTGTKSIVVEPVGAGGGGQACAGASSTAATFSGGGASGTYARYRLTTVPSSVSCTVGTGGGSGAAGGATTFGSYCTTPGGATGANGSSTTAAAVGGGVPGASATTSAVTVIFTCRGNAGGFATAVSSAGGQAVSVVRQSLAQEAGVRLLVLEKQEQALGVAAADVFFPLAGRPPFN